MLRMLGYAANQLDRLRFALAAERAALQVDEPVRCDGWGVGSYQSGELLLRRRPSDARETLRLPELLVSLRTSCAMAHLRHATAGGHTLENTHPFRFRQWLFAAVGTLPNFPEKRAALREVIPGFIALNIRGETDSELLFHRLLAAVHAQGRLDDPEYPRTDLLEALRDGLRGVDTTLGARAPMAFLVSNGSLLVGVRRGAPLAYVRRLGLRDGDQLRAKNPDLLGSEGRKVHLESFRYVFLASGGAPGSPGWSEVPEEPDGSALVVDAKLELHHHAL